jgi:hypothetical protein
MAFSFVVILPSPSLTGRLDKVLSSVSLSRKFGLPVTTYLLAVLHYFAAAASLESWDGVSRSMD